MNTAHKIESNTDATYAVYVGTYGKYNNGSIKGAWLDLEDYSSAEEFYDACRELHADEHDPEFMFQDWQGVPSQYIGESHIDPEFWDYLDAVNSSGYDAEVFEAAADLDIEYSMLDELYQGEYSSDEEFAQQLAEDLGLIDENAQWPNNCIDWEYAARELMHDYGSSNGHYFRTSY